MNDEEGGAECKSQVYYFPPDVALRYCPKLDYKKMMQIHGTMAELQYHLYKMQLPFGLDTEPCPGFGAAIAETVILGFRDSTPSAPSPHPSERQPYGGAVP